MQDFEIKALDIYRQGIAAQIQRLVNEVVKRVDLLTPTGYTCSSLDPKKIEKLLVSSLKIEEQSTDPEGDWQSHYPISPEIAKKCIAVLHWAMGEEPLVTSTIAISYHKCPIYQVIPQIILLLEGDTLKHYEDKDEGVDYLLFDEFSGNILRMVAQELHSMHDPGTPLDGYSEVMQNVIDALSPDKLMG